MQYSYKALIDQVQASEKELQDALESMEVCIIDGMCVYVLLIRCASHPGCSHRLLSNIGARLQSGDCPPDTLLTGGGGLGLQGCPRGGMLLQA